MFGGLFKRFRRDSRPLEEKGIESVAISQGKEPGDSSQGDTTSSLIPPGWTLREYLDYRIRDRCRWLEGRYGGDGEGRDHGQILKALGAPTVAAIRRPPLAARRLLQENRKPDATLRKLEKIIESDPALLQSLLKHANSVYYSAGSSGPPVVSVPPALQRLGSKGIEIVVMSHMVEGALCRPGGGMDDLAADVWKHMVRVAPLARGLAPAFDVHPDEAYALGLLHDVGKLVLFNRVADLRKALRRPVRVSDGFIPALLRELHEPLGSLAVLEWGLGEGAALAVAVHHRDPIPEPSPVMGEALFLADKLDFLVENGQTPNLEALWAAGGLTADLHRVKSRWEELRGQAESAA